MQINQETEDFLQADVEALVQKKLTIEEKTSLLGAPSWWSTTAIPRLSIPSVRMSDGPNGARGSSHFLSSPAQCVPCATCLGATFDTELVHQVGQFLAHETKLKSAVLLLAPTCNIQRNPLGGRAFESFSEDPHLSGMIASAYVNGLQSKGVGATIKHFVANDQEHERTAANSVISERALREIYLYPFMLAQKISKPFAFMTAYGRIDNVHCSENIRLLQHILRDEWKFDGAVISDWFGTYSVSEALIAGLDLEMPGPPHWRTPTLVNHLLSAQKLKVSHLDTCSTNLLKLVQKLAKVSPEVVYGDGKERSKNTPADRTFNRKVASSGMVLLKNKGEVLPINGEKKCKVAVIGPNAKGRVISGGGSAYLKASYIVTPWQGLESGAPKGVELAHAVGCYAHKYLPTLEAKLTTSGKPGWLCEFYTSNQDGTPKDFVASNILQDTRVKLNDYFPPGLSATSPFSLKLTGSLTNDVSGPFEFGLTVAGRAKLFINGQEIIDNWTKQRPGDFFYGQGSVEEKATVELEKGKAVDVYVEYSNQYPSSTGERDLSQPAIMLGVRLGGAEEINPDQAIVDAAELAKESDVAVVVVGLTHEWEAEGTDRPSLDLPGRQVELICEVAKANPKIIVVVQAGSAVDYSWSSKVAGIIQAWYSGNEVGNAIADVIYGIVNPSGRMPLTFPKKEQDIPAWYNNKSINGQIHYREDIFVGYKHYLARSVEPQWAFGYGLSYTTFSISDLTIAGSSNPTSFTITAEITNTGSRVGRQVLQVYVTHPTTCSVVTAPVQLRGFVKSPDIKPGESVHVQVELDKFAFAFWDEPKSEWKVEAGEYVVKAGSSSVDLVLEEKVKIEQDVWWRGL